MGCRKKAMTDNLKIVLMVALPLLAIISLPLWF